METVLMVYGFPYWPIDLSTSCPGMFDFSFSSETETTTTRELHCVSNDIVGSEHDVHSPRMAGHRILFTVWVFPRCTAVQNILYPQLLP